MHKRKLSSLYMHFASNCDGCITCPDLISVHVTCLTSTDAIYLWHWHSSNCGCYSSAVAVRCKPPHVILCPWSAYMFFWSAATNVIHVQHVWSKTGAGSIPRIISLRSILRGVNHRRIQCKTQTVTVIYPYLLISSKRKMTSSKHPCVTTCLFFFVSKTETSWPMLCTLCYFIRNRPDQTYDSIRGRTHCDIWLGFSASFPVPQTSFKGFPVPQKWSTTLLGIIAVYIPGEVQQYLQH